MRWKPEVVLKKQDTYLLQLGTKQQPVLPKDTYLVEAMKGGITEDEKLIQCIMQHEQIDETAAAFGLAQFILDYGNFIAEDESHYLITG